MAGVVRECVMRNGRDVESNITVGPDQTSIQVNDLGKVLQLYNDYAQCSTHTGFCLKNFAWGGRFEH